jgi:transposase
MPKPYSVDLRERAVAAYEAGRLQTEVVQLFKISLATLRRWLAQRRAGQSLAPKTYRPGPRGAPSRARKPWRPWKPSSKPIPTSACSTIVSAGRRPPASR